MDRVAAVVLLAANNEPAPSGSIYLCARIDRPLLLIGANAPDWHVKWRRASVREQLVAVEATWEVLL